MTLTILTRGQEPLRLVAIANPIRLVGDRVANGELRIVDGTSTVFASRGSDSANSTIVFDTPLVMPEPAAGGGGGAIT